MGDNDNSEIARYSILFDQEMPEVVVDKSNRWRYFKRALTRVLRDERENAVIKVHTKHEAHLAQASAYQWGRSIKIEKRYNKKVRTNIVPLDKDGNIVRSDEAVEYQVFVYLSPPDEADKEREKKEEVNLSNDHEDHELEPVLN